MREKRSAYRIFVGKPEGKRPLGRPKCRWKDNTKMDLRETEWSGVDWFDLTQDRDQLEVSCEHGNEILGFIKYWEILEWLRNWQLLKKSHIRGGSSVKSHLHK
jgi:hypothetical protein